MERRNPLFAVTPVTSATRPVDKALIGLFKSGNLLNGWWNGDTCCLFLRRRAYVSTRSFRELKKVVLKEEEENHHRTERLVVCPQ